MTSSGEGPFISRRSRRRRYRNPPWLRRLSPLLAGLLLVLGSLWLGQALVERMSLPPAEGDGPAVTTDGDEVPREAPPDRLEPGERLPTYTGRPDLAELYRIQVGAFSREENALRLVERLAAAGLPAVVRSRDPYQVVIGYAATRRAALAWSERLPEDVSVYLAVTPLAAGDPSFSGAGTDSPLPGTLALVRTLISVEARWWDHWLGEGSPPPAEELAVWQEQIGQIQDVVAQVIAQRGSPATGGVPEERLLGLLDGAAESLDRLAAARTSTGTKGSAAMAALIRTVEEYTALMQHLTVSTKNMVN